MFAGVATRLAVVGALVLAVGVGRPVGTADRTAHASPGLGLLPASVQGVASTAMGSAEPAFRAHRTGQAVRLAGGGLTGRLTGAGVMQLQGGAGSFQLAGVGRGRSLRAVDRIG